MPVNWEDPGQARHGLRPPPPKWAAEAAELRAHPGVWGVIETLLNTPLNDEDAAEVRRSRQVMRSNALRIQRGKLRAFEPPGTFEASTRIVAEEGTIKLHVRYIGYKKALADGSFVQVDADGNELGITPRPPAPQATATRKERTWQPKSARGKKRKSSPRKKAS